MTVLVTMNERERFREALSFGEPDKVPLQPGGPRESTLAAWHQQGLPSGVNWYAYLMDKLGIEYEPPKCRVPLGVSFKMIPTFEEKVLEHRDGHYVVQDWMGAITEISDEYDYTYIRAAKDFVTRKWHSFPVRTREDFVEKIQWRYDPRDPERFPEDFEARCRALRERDYVLRLTVNGPFWQLREWCGLEHLCVLMVEQPDFVHEMIDVWDNFVVETLTPIIERVELDYFQISEDMGYKMHSMISPAMARRFLFPLWERWTTLVKASGCPVICMDSDGYMAELLPLWVEAGINCCFPIEVAAGNDIVAYRHQYGKQMAYLGGLDKRALAAGGDIMRAEIMRVVPPLLEEGGFIPGCDHGVPPDISWPNFVAYTRLLAELLGWL
jgi:uroporphyrinogen decarboxylase